MTYGIGVYDVNGVELFYGYQVRNIIQNHLIIGSKTVHPFGGYSGIFKWEVVPAPSKFKNNSAKNAYKVVFNSDNSVTWYPVSFKYDQPLMPQIDDDGNWVVNENAQLIGLIER